MCCRYWTDESPELRPIVEEMNRSSLLERWPEGARIVRSGEVRPTDVAPVVASNRAGARAVFPMKWGFAGRTLLINARAETAPDKPTFREAWAAHRCAVPASGYFEWEHVPAPGGATRAGERYRIEAPGGGLWLCGLYRLEAGLPAFVILQRHGGKLFLKRRKRTLSGPHLLAQYFHTAGQLLFAKGVFADLCLHCPLPALKFLQRERRFLIL